MNEKIEKLIKALREKPRTAKQLAARFKVTVPTIENRLERVKAHGYVLQADFAERPNTTGPKPRRYWLRRVRA